MKIPNSPFSTRLSGSAKETELRLRSIFQWKKRRPPIVVFVLAAVLILSCCGLVSCRMEPDEQDVDSNVAGTPSDVNLESNATAPWTGHPFSLEAFFASYVTDFPEYSYTGAHSATVLGRKIELEDTPENLAEEMVWNTVWLPFVGNYESYIALMGPEHMRISAENESEQCAEYGGIFSTVTIHNLSVLTEQDYQPVSYYFSDEATAERFMIDVWHEVWEYGLTEYTVVYVDLSWEWTPEQLALGPQLGNGRYERLCLLGKTETDSDWKMYNIYWGEYDLNRSYPNESDADPEKSIPPDSMEYRDQLIRDYYAETYQRNVYLAGEEPDRLQESDLRIEEITVLGETRVYEVTGQLLEVFQSRYDGSDWNQYSSYLVITKGMENDYDRVIGTAYIRNGQTAEEVILEKIHGLSDLEVSLWREGYPWPVGPGSQIHIYREAYDGPETVEVLDGWEPIYSEGDYWAMRRWSGVETLCYYQLIDAQTGYYDVRVNTFDTTRTDLRTYRDICVGDSREKVLEAYPELKSGDYWGKYPGEDYLWYCTSEQDFGAALIFFFENDAVSRIVLTDMFN